MNLLMTISILFSDDPNIPIQIKHVAREAKIEDLNSAGFLSQECVEAIKKIQARSDKPKIKDKSLEKLIADNQALIRKTNKLMEGK